MSMKELRIEVVENGFVVMEIGERLGEAYSKWAFESSETLAVFIKNWGRDNFRVEAGCDSQAHHSVAQIQEQYKQQEKPKPLYKTGVWLQHDGGECPVSRETIVKVKFSGYGEVSSVWKACDLGWSSITEYMIVE